MSRARSLERLLEGRDQIERQAGIGSAVPRETRLVDVSIADGLASVELSNEFEAGGELALAQVVYTLTQFPSVERVAVNGGEPRTRDDFEELTPAILVESPLSTETVTNPVRITERPTRSRPSSTPSSSMRRAVWSRTRW